MPTRRKAQDKRRQAARFFGQGQFTMLYRELCQSSAYQALSPVARLVLIDMLGVYGKASCKKAGYCPNGFRYTYAHCLEPCSRNSFYRAVGEILKHGFFETPAELQPMSALAPRVFTPSIKWKKFQAPAQSGQRAEVKARNLARDAARKRNYHTTGKTE